MFSALNICHRSISTSHIAHGVSSGLADTHQPQSPRPHSPSINNETTDIHRRQQTVCQREAVLQIHRSPNPIACSAPANRWRHAFTRFLTVQQLGRVKLDCYTSDHTTHLHFRGSIEAKGKRSTRGLFGRIFQLVKKRKRGSHKYTDSCISIVALVVAYTS